MLTTHSLRARWVNDAASSTASTEPVCVPRTSQTGTSSASSRSRVAAAYSAMLSGRSGMSENPKPGRSGAMVSRSVPKRGSSGAYMALDDGVMCNSSSANLSATASPGPLRRTCSWPERVGTSARRMAVLVGPGALSGSVIRTIRTKERMYRDLGGTEAIGGIEPVHRDIGTLCADRLSVMGENIVMRNTQHGWHRELGQCRASREAVPGPVAQRVVRTGVHQIHHALVEHRRGGGPAPGARGPPPRPRGWHD